MHTNCIICRIYGHGPDAPWTVGKHFCVRSWPKIPSWKHLVHGDYNHAIEYSKHPRAMHFRLLPLKVPGHAHPQLWTALFPPRPQSTWVIAMQNLRLNMHYLVPSSYGLLAATQTRHQITGTTLNQISTGTAATRQILYILNNITSAYLPKSAQIDLGLIPPGFLQYMMAPIQKPTHWPLSQWSTPASEWPCFCRPMMSSNGNIFRVNGSLCREFTHHRWIPLTKASDA